jgi:hypothetical protein
MSHPCRDPSVKAVVSDRKLQKHGFDLVFVLLDLCIVLAHIRTLGVCQLCHCSGSWAVLV